MEKVVWFIEADESEGRYLAANVVDVLIEEIKKGADTVVRMSQAQFLSSYVDAFHKKLLVLPKVPMMSYTPPVSQVPSRPGSAKRAQSRPNSGTVKIDFNSLKPSPAILNDECIVIIIDIQCTDAIEAIVHLLQRKTSVSAHIAKIIVISSLLTWAAKRYPKGITEPDLEFPNRVPVACAMSAYSSENSLSRLNGGIFLKRGGRGVVIVGVGLLYGLDGLDLKDTLRSLWQWPHSRPLDPHQTQLAGLLANKGHVPLLHIDSLALKVASLARLALAQRPFPAGFEPAADPCPLPCQDLLLALHGGINGPPAATQLLAQLGQTGPPAGRPSVRSGLWRSDLWFPADPPGSLLDRLQGEHGVWPRFVAAAQLAPVRLLLAGPPRSGKSEACRLIADRLQLEVVDALSAVRFALSMDPAALPLQAQPLDGALAAVRAEVAQAIQDSRAAEAGQGKKPPKGGSVSQERLPGLDRPPEEAEVTPQLLQAMSADLLRRCVAARLQCDPRSRRGYLLDLWGEQALFAEGLASASRLCSCLSASTDGEVRGEQAVRRLLDGVVELQSGDKAIVERLLQVQQGQPGGGKAKEAQAAARALEAQLAAYRQAMQGDSHQAVRALEAGLPGSALRKEVATDGLQALADTVCEHVAALRGQWPGWLPSPPAAHPPPSPPPAERLPEEPVREDSSSGAGNAAEEPADHIEALGDADRKKLTARAEKLQAFLTATVLPHVASGMVRLMRDRPADPVAFLSDFLLQQALTQRSQSCEQARKTFFDLMLNPSPPNTAATEASLSMYTSRTGVDD